MKNPSVYSIMGMAAIYLAAAGSARAGTLKCPPDSVKVGNVCVDTYEESVWQIPPSNIKLVKLVQQGKATLALLTAGGATELSVASGAATCSPTFPANFPRGGQWTPVLGSTPPSPGVYAVSIPGVVPTACIDWFQAAQACRLAGKRLLTNLEWQDAAAGTPDPGATPGPNDCNTNSTAPVNTGSLANCKSSWGVFDMVGNVDDWVADWADVNPTNCTDSTTGLGLPGNDSICFGGGADPRPAALLRGGDFYLSSLGGVFMVGARNYPTFTATAIGFRCAR